jgi:trigger factor
MNITRENIDELNAVVKVKVEKSDYQEQVDQVLKDYRKKASIKGFRPGKVPMGMIKNMYGNAVLVDEVNKIVSDSLFKHIQEENLKILGEPLPSKTIEADFDIANKEDFEFAFDLGLTPEFEVKLSKRDKLVDYQVKIDDKMMDDAIKNHASRYGTVEESETAEESSLLKGNFAQLDQEGNELEDGVRCDEAMFAINRIEDEGIKKLAFGAKKDDIIDLELKKAFSNAADVASMLKIEKEDAEQLDGKFRFSVSTISTHRPAEVNQELFDKVYGEGTVKSEEEYKAKVEEELKLAYKGQTDFKLLLDAKEKLVKKAKINLPDEFLKRWLVAANEELTQEQVEKDYENMQTEFAWQLIKGKIQEEQEIKIEAEEIIDFAKKSVLLQFQQYGLASIPDEQLEAFAKNQLENEEERRKIIERLMEDKIMDYVKEAVKLEEKEVSLDELTELFKTK